MVPRSRLAFSGGSGTLNPDSVSFVVKRTSDNKYWDGAAGEWIGAEFKNPATKDGDSWDYAVTGDERRLFVDTEVVVEMHALKGGQPHKSSVAPTIAIR
jgi:hypothetical protein